MGKYPASRILETVQVDQMEDIFYVNADTGGWGDLSRAILFRIPVDLGEHYEQKIDSFEGLKRVEFIAENCAVCEPGEIITIECGEFTKVEDEDDED